MGFKRWRQVASIFVLGLAVPATAAGGGGTLQAHAGGTAAAPRHIDCSNGNRFLCPEVFDSEAVFGEGHYVGHDEPSLLFNSNKPGSGNRMQYSGILPKEPPSQPIPGRSWDFNLYAAFWYGMVMCDTQSYPEQLSTCTRNSDSNIVPAGNPNHAGSAYTELQFYPPGYVQQWNGFSCSATQWCVALNIWSLSRNPVTGQSLNATCQAKTGVEYGNFAYLTHSGIPQGPPNPVNFDPIASGTPDPSKVFFLNQGDHYTVTLHDTPHGLQTTVHDTTTGESGTMTASAANGFGQVKYAPDPSTECTNIPYDFHPMYSTSGPQTTVPWAAATYNVAFDTEVGHFDRCSGTVDVATGTCLGTEGVGSNKEPADVALDDQGCWPASASSLVQVAACEGSNVGYDGNSYLRDWPNGNTNLRPTPTIFTSPLTGEEYNTNYTSVAFNTDVPAIEYQIGTCDRLTGAGCTLRPPTDDGTPAQFYPYYSSGHALGGCAWTVGQSVPGFTTNSYGGLSQYGQLLSVTYPGPNGPIHYYRDYQGNLSHNPCPSSAGGEDR